MLLAAGITGTHIPFKGSNDALTEVIAGRVDFYYSPIGLAPPFLKREYEVNAELVKAAGIQPN